MCWARRWKWIFRGFCLIVKLVPEEGIWQLGMLYLITCKFVCTIFIRVNQLGHMLTCSGLSCLIISFFNCHSWFFTAVDLYVIINLYRTRVEEKTLFCWLLGRLYLWGFNGLVICYCDAWPACMLWCTAVRLLSILWRRICFFLWSKICICVHSALRLYKMYCFHCSLPVCFCSTFFKFNFNFLVYVWVLWQLLVLFLFHLFPLQFPPLPYWNKFVHTHCSAILGTPSWH